MMQLQENEEKMTPEQFVYWLQGFIEMGEPEKLTKKQTQMIKDHLAQVFTKKTPNYTTTTTIQDLQVPVRPLSAKKSDHGSLCSCLECRGRISTAVIC